MKKILLFIILAFTAGFFTHALLFPDFLANGITNVAEVNAPNVTPTQASTMHQAFETYISYDGSKFSRHNITIERGSYLIITNISKDQLMWLESKNPLLATPRGYGESEAIRQRLDITGQYIVTDKNNTQEKLVITVK